MRGAGTEEFTDLEWRWAGDAAWNDKSDFDERVRDGEGAQGTWEVA